MTTSEGINGLEAGHQFEFSEEGLAKAVGMAVSLRKVMALTHNRMFSTTQPALNPYQFKRSEERLAADRTKLGHVIEVLDMVAPRQDDEEGWRQIIEDEVKGRLKAEGVEL